MRKLKDLELTLAIETYVSEMFRRNDEERSFGSGLSSRCEADSIMKIVMDYMDDKPVNSKPWEAFRVGRKP